MDKKIPKHEICYIYFLLLYNAISIHYDNDSLAVIINNYHNWIPLPSHTFFQSPLHYSKKLQFLYFWIYARKKSTCTKEDGMVSCWLWLISIIQIKIKISMSDLFGIHVFKSMILNTFVYLFQREKK